MLIIQNNISQNINNWLQDRNYHAVFVLVDENTKKHCLPLLKLEKECFIIETESGEINKNLQSCQKIWKNLLDKYADRNSLLINLGGGVITDMGAFCASTYKRGINFINIPTTLLSMVDASIGAKTGIDFQGQKNMIGLFSQANEVFIDSIFLSTLEKRELLSGFAEVLKHGLIQDRRYYEDCISSFANETIHWKNVIEESIQIKSSIVSQDPKEKGLRKILNFGHTTGHAFESYSLEHHQKPLLHGEAIILGMIFALKLSSILNFISEKEIKEICSDFLKIYNFNSLEDFDLQEIRAIALNDKKNRNSNLQFIVLKEIGNAIFDKEVRDNHFDTAYDFVFKCIEKI